MVWYPLWVFQDTGWCHETHSFLSSCRLDHLDESGRPGIVERSDDIDRACAGL